MTIYVRHHLKGYLKLYKSKRGSELDFEFWQMEWQFNQNYRFCRRLRRKVRSASLVYALRGQNDFNGFRFVEFYETDHRLLEITFPNDSDYFEIIGEENGKFIPNNVLLNCERPPKVSKEALNIECPPDVKNSDLIKDYQIYASNQENKEKSSQPFWVINRVINF